jgi:glutamyl-tRNA reductase
VVRRVLRQRPQRPLFCIDLAVPRNIDPAVAALANTRLFGVDDLAAVVEHGRATREESCREAYRIVAEEKAEFLRCHREVELGPALGRIARAAETLRRRELARCQRLAEMLTPEQAALFESMSRTLTNKLLDGPLRAIRHAARDGDEERLRRLLAQWDGLDPF